ncbi:MAG: serine/threonine-protein kinase [Planctomycetota bacterium]
MSTSPPPEPTHRTSKSEEEVPLGLSESSEGSTMPVEEGHTSDAGPGGTPTPGQTGDSGPGGSTTGGFETTLGKLVVQRGLATAEEVELCAALIKEAEADEPRTLGDLLVDNAFVTTRQLERLKSELEAKRSTGQIPGYKIKKKIGSGAMATVFLARQLSLDRLVAIKVLPKRLSANENFIERFYKEGRSAAQLNHPNIVSAYDVGKAGEHHYFVMEYVDGKTVYDKITKGRRLEEAEALEIVIQVAEALRHAHERGFIHRDIKPKNIMISLEGKAKLADLGLARALSDKAAAEAEAGRAYGTPYYISPEQIRGEVKIEPAADIYGLGATLYHMVTGRVPYEGKNPSAVMHKHLKAQLVPPDHLNPDITAGCAQVIEMMLAKSRSNRYRRVDDLLEDLKLIQNGDPPHFARRQIDLAAPELTTDSGQVTTPARAAGSAGGGDVLVSPLLRLLLALLIVSVLVNVVLGLAALLK